LTVVIRTGIEKNGLSQSSIETNKEAV
jgi:hypothetical protein